MQEKFNIIVIIEKNTRIFEFNSKQERTRAFSKIRKVLNEEQNKNFLKKQADLFVKQ